MFDPSLLTDREHREWSDYRLSLATGTGIKRSAREPVDLTRVPTVADPRQIILEDALAHLDDSDGPVMATARTGAVSRVWTFPALDILYGLDPADYRRIQRLRLSLEARARRRSFYGWRPLTIDAIPDRFRAFDPLPAFEQITAANQFGHRYISR
jgi:hypothetical protein